MNRKKFFERYLKFLRMAIRLSDLTRKEGLLALESEVEDIDDEFFKKGLRLVIDGTDGAIIDEILSARMAHEKNKDERLFLTIEKRAVLAMQSGTGYRVFMELLNAYAGTSSKEEWAIINMIDEEDEKVAAAETANQEEEIDPALRINMSLTEEDAFHFDDIATRLDSRCIQEVLRNVDSQDLAKALKRAGKNMRETMYRNMSKSAAAMLKEDMEYMGDVSEEAVKEAQLTILNVVRRLNDVGEIVVGK